MDQSELQAANDESTSLDHAKTIADVVANTTKGYYEALEKARERILAGEDRFVAMLNEISRYKAEEISELERINASIAANQENEKLLATLREMRSNAVREWNILNGDHSKAEDALNAYLHTNADAYNY